MPRNQDDPGFARLANTEITARYTFGVLETHVASSGHWRFKFTPADGGKAVYSAWQKPLRRGVTRSKYFKSIVSLFESLYQVYQFRV